jgi:hypothetical protein
MKFATFRLALPMFDPEQPGGAPASGTPSAPAAPAAPSGGQPSAPAPGAPAAGAPAAPAKPQFTYGEDRSNWVPSHVVRQRTEAAEKLQRDLDYERRRVAALSGVTMPTQPDPESDAIKQQFNKLYPGLAKLEAMADKLERAGNFDFEGIQSSQQQVWVQHGTQVLSQLAEKAKQAYGGADLPPKTLGRIQRAFVSEVAEDPDMKARYESGDMSIIDEFIKDYTTGVLDPYRRSSAAAAAPNNLARRLPRGGGSSAIVGARPATLKPSDPGFHAAAFNRYNEGA